MNRFGELLRQLRLEKRFSISAVARHLRYSVAYVSDVELGRKAPFSANKIIVIAKFLDVDPAPLLRAAAQDKGTYELNVKGYPKPGFDLLTGLARGKRSPDEFTELLELLEKQNRERAAKDGEKES